MPRPVSDRTRAILAALPGTSFELAERTGQPIGHIRVALFRARKRGEVVSVPVEGGRTFLWSLAGQPEAQPDA